jgi:hypothetical protein
VRSGRRIKLIEKLKRSPGQFRRVRKICLLRGTRMKEKVLGSSDDEGGDKADAGLGAAERRAEISKRSGKGEGKGEAPFLTVYQWNDEMGVATVLKMEQVRAKLGNETARNRLGRLRRV